ncbi:MAG TPA: hypothetical protein VFY28_01660 [Candidatus Paceibacterota bacterium]|nr:hypothetical protein [Candidatus Paceibacterota bacterium]
MATIVNTPANTDGGAAGWAVAAIIVVALALLALFVWPGFARVGSTQEAGDTINVQVPALDTSVTPAAPAAPAAE